MRSEPDRPPMTLGTAAAAHVRFMMWCKACGYRSEPDPGEQARWYRPEMPVARMGQVAGVRCRRSCLFQC